MKRIKTLVALLMVSVLCSSVWARTWTSKDGNFTLEAELVEFKQGKAFLKRSDGRVIGVPVEKLSEADQRFLQEQDANSPSDNQPEELAPGSPISVETALRKQVSYEFIDTPLSDVIDYLANKSGVNFYLSHRSLNNAGIGGDTPITAQAKNVPLSTALEEILVSRELTYVPQSDVIMITTAEQAENMQFARAYQVMKPIRADTLIKELTRVIAPESWSDVGGPAALSPLSFGVLVIRQNAANHRKIAEHYKDLLRPLPVVKKGKDVPKPTAQGVEKILDRPMTVEFLETPLKDAVAYLSDQNKVRVTVDERALNDIGLDVETSLNIHLNQVPLRTVLDLMLEPSELTWYEEKGKIEITSLEQAEMKLVPVSYPIGAKAGPGGLREWAEVISSTIAPHSWDEVGGPGTITPTQRGTLEILQSYRVHRQITELLEAISTIK